MASSASAKLEKRLGEFLKEQQEPFILDVYLLERGYSKKWTPIEEDSSNKFEKSTSKKRKGLFPFCKVFTTLHKKLAFHHKQCSSDVIKVVTDSNTRNENLSVSVPHHGNFDQTVVETDRFSTASSSTVFNSCSDIDDQDGISLSPYEDMDTFQASSFFNNGVHSQQATNNGKHCQRCIEVSMMHETLNQDVWKTENRSVLVPKKIREDSLLSAALWSSLIQTAKRGNYTKELREFLGPNNVSQVLKSKRVMHKSNQLLFDCVSEITINLPRKEDTRQKGYKQQRGPEEELGKILWERTKNWGQHAANETNLKNLLTFDFLDSMNEWSEFKRQVKAISVEIADEILEGVKNEIVSEIIEMSTPTL